VHKARVLAKMGARNVPELIRVSGSDETAQRAQP